MAFFGLTTADKGEHEPYPFFSWSLFSKIPNDRDEWTLEVLQAGGMRYDPPLRFSQLTGFFSRIGQSPVQYQQILREMRFASQRSDAAALASGRKELERMFPPGAFSYRVVHVSYTPVEYWNSQHYRILGEVYAASGTAQ